jgi:NAD(P)H dehydrogenase (quinone)
MSSDSPIKYLITGATGGLGASIIGTLLTIVPASDIAISSSSPSNAESLLAKFPGTQFRVADYDKPETLDAAFAGVEKLFFVSGNDFMKIVSQHGNVVEAAKKARIGHVSSSS